MDVRGASDQASAGSPDDGPDIDTLARGLKPLGNTARLRLLDLLIQPMYVEEVAKHLQMSRPGARKHLDCLVEVGVITKRIGRRDSGPVVEYVLDRAGLFNIQMQFSEMGSRREAPPGEQATRTLLAEKPSRGKAVVSNIPQPGLAVVRGLDPGRVFPLGTADGVTWRLGRGGDVDIGLDYDPFVSTRHAEVRMQASGLVLTDLYSKNGTYVNWRRLRAGVDVPLAQGDIVGVGKTLFVLQMQTG